MSVVNREFRVRIAYVASAEVDGNVEFTLGLQDIAEPVIVTTQIPHVLAGATEMRPFEVLILDRAGAFTAAMTYGGRWVAIGRLLDVGYRDLPSGDWVTYGTGRISAADEHDGPGRYRIEVSDESWVGRKSKLFQFADTTRLWPYGINSPLSPGPGVIAWRGFPPANVADGVRSSLPNAYGHYRIRVTAGGSGRGGGKEILESLIRWIDSDVIAQPYAGSGTTGNFTHLRLRYAGNDYPVIGFGPSVVIGDLTDGLKNPVILNPRVATRSVAVDVWVYVPIPLSDPPLTGEAYLWAPTAPPGKGLVLHVGVADEEHDFGSTDGWLHKAELTRRYFDLTGQRYDNDSIEAVLADTSIPLIAPRVMERVDDPEKWMQDNVWAPDLIVLTDRFGRRKLVNLRMPRDIDPDSLPMIDASNANRMTWQLLGRDAVNTITWKYLHHGQPATPYGNNIDTVEPQPDQLDGFIVEEREADPIESLDSIYAVGRRPLTLALLGALEPTATLARRQRTQALGRGSLFADATAAMSEDILDVFQDGAFRFAGEVSREFAETLEEGDLVLIDMEALQLPNPASGERNNLRLARVLGITPRLAYAELEILDMGASEQPLTAPSISVTLSSDDPNVAVISVGGVPAGATATVEIGISGSTTPPESWLHVLTGLTDGDHEFSGLPALAGAYVHVRGSSHAFQRITSAYAYAYVLRAVPQLFDASVEIDELGVPHVRGNWNAATAGVRISFIVYPLNNVPGTPGDDADFDVGYLADGIALATTVDVDEAILVRFEPWSEFSSDAVSGIAGDTVDVTGRVKQDARARIESYFVRRDEVTGLLHIYARGDARTAELQVLTANAAGDPLVLDQTIEGREGETSGIEPTSSELFFRIVPYDEAGLAGVAVEDVWQATTAVQHIAIALEIDAEGQATLTVSRLAAIVQSIGYSISVIGHADAIAGSATALDFSGDILVIDLGVWTEGTVLYACVKAYDYVDASGVLLDQRLARASYDPFPTLVILPVPNVDNVTEASLGHASLTFYDPQSRVTDVYVREQVGTGGWGTFEELVTPPYSTSVARTEHHVSKLQYAYTFLNADDAPQTVQLPEVVFPALLTPQVLDVSVDFDNATGNPIISVIGNYDTASYKYLAEFGAVPSGDPTTAPGALTLNGREVVRAQPAAIIGEPGEVLYGKIAPYSGAGGSGTAGPVTEFSATFPILTLLREPTVVIRPDIRGNSAEYFIAVYDPDGTIHSVNHPGTGLQWNWGLGGGWVAINNSTPTGEYYSTQEDIPAGGLLTPVLNVTWFNGRVNVSTLRTIVVEESQAPQFLAFGPLLTINNWVQHLVVTWKAQSIKIAVSKSAMPSAATVRAETAIALDDLSDGRYQKFIDFDDPSQELAPGETLFIAAFAYENDDGTGGESLLRTNQLARSLTEIPGGAASAYLDETGNVLIRYNGNLYAGSAFWTIATDDYDDEIANAEWDPDGDLSTSCAECPLNRVTNVALETGLRLTSPDQTAYGVVWFSRPTDGTVDGSGTSEPIRFKIQGVDQRPRITALFTQQDRFGRIIVGANAQGTTGAFAYKWSTSSMPADDISGATILNNANQSPPASNFLSGGKNISLVYPTLLTPGQKLYVRAWITENADGSGLWSSPSLTAEHTTTAVAPPTLHDLFVSASLGLRSVRFKVYDGGARTVNVRVWTNRLSTTQPDPTGNYDGLRVLAGGTTGVDVQIAFDSAFTPFGGGADVFPLLNIPVNESTGKRIYVQLEATDGAGASISIMYDILLSNAPPAISASGAIVKTVAYEGDTRTPQDTDDDAVHGASVVQPATPGVIGAGVPQSDGTAQHVITRGRQSGLARNGEDVTFDLTGQGAPTSIRFYAHNALLYEPGPRWGVTGDGSETNEAPQEVINEGEPNEYFILRRQIPQMEARNVTASGFTPVLRLRALTGAAPTITGRNDLFPGSNLTVAGQTAEVTLTNAPANSPLNQHRYRAHFVLHQPNNVNANGAFRFIVGIDSSDNAGSTWTRRATQEFILYGNSIPTGALSVVKYIDVVVAGLDDSDKLRLVADLLPALSGGDPGYIAPNNSGQGVTYSTAGTDPYTYASMTPEDDQFVRWEADWG